MRVSIATTYSNDTRILQVGDVVTITVQGVVATVSADLVDVTKHGDEVPKHLLGEISIAVEPTTKAQVVHEQR